MNALTRTQDTAIKTQGITGELFQKYISFLQVSPKTVETYTKALKQFFLYLQAKGINQPTREDIQTYRDELKEGHAPATVQGYITAIRLFFSWTEQEGYYPNIANHVKGEKTSKEHKKDYLAPGQVKAILERIDRSTVQGRRDYALFTLMVTCGLRDIEVHRANIEDLRPKGETTVLYIMGKGRNEKADFVKVPEEVERAIRESLADRKGTDGQDPLFSSLSNNSKGGRMTTRSISRTIKGLMQKAGYDSNRLTAHSLRHTAITLSLLGGESIREVQMFARHSNISTTQIYSHDLDRTMNTCGRTVANAIF